MGKDVIIALDFDSKEKTLEQGYLQLLPGVYPCDGFFIARFRKKDGQ